jgi:hypothetical protein
MPATGPVDGQCHQVGVASTRDRATSGNRTGARSWITEAAGV